MTLTSPAMRQSGQIDYNIKHIIVGHLLYQCEEDENVEN